MNTRNPLFIYAIIIMAMVFWSLSFIWYKQAYVNFQPITVIVLRLAIAAPLVAVLSWSFGRLERIKAGDLKFFLLLALFEPFLYFMGESFGMTIVSATLASVIISTIPIFTAFAASYLFKEKFVLINYLGLILSVIGVFMVIIGEKDAFRSALTGIILMFLAVVSAVCYTIYVKKLSHHYSAFTIVTYQSLFGLIYFLPVFICTEFKGFIRVHHTLVSFIPVLKLAAFASVMAFLFFVFSLKKLGLARANVFVNLIPVFTAAFSFLLLAEKFTLVKILGILVVVTGLLLTQLQYNKSTQS